SLQKVGDLFGEILVLTVLGLVDDLAVHHCGTVVRSDVLDQEYETARVSGGAGRRLHGARSFRGKENGHGEDRNSQERKHGRMTIDAGLPVSTGQVFDCPQRPKAESAQPLDVFWPEIHHEHYCSTAYPQLAGVARAALA